MFASNTAVVLLFSGLGLVALALGLLVRRYSSFSLAVGLAGLLLLTTASTWIATAGSAANGTQLHTLLTENSKLAGTIEGQRAEMEDLRKRAPQPGPASSPPPSVDVERLKEDLQAEQRKSSEAERKAADANARAVAADENVREAERRLKEDLQAEQRKSTAAEGRAVDAERRASDATSQIAALNVKIRKAEIAKLAAEDKVAALEAKLRSMVPAPPPPKPPDLQRIRRALISGDRPFYETRDERELIPGRKGSWHVVRLLQGGVELTFADREFVLSDASQIKASAVRLRDDILVPLTQAGKDWQLYVRGAADARRVSRPTLREFFYLPRLPGGVHAPQPRGKQISIPVQNEDLPNLRADWLRETVRSVLGTVASGDIAILENPPQQGHGRTAELVLFVKW